MEIRFLGTSSCILEPEREAASFVINGKHLVDTGWQPDARRRLAGVRIGGAGAQPAHPPELSTSPGALT